MQSVSMPRNSYPAFWKPVPFGRFPSPYKGTLGQATIERPPLIDNPALSFLVSATGATASGIAGWQYIKGGTLVFGIPFVLAAIALGLKAYFDLGRMGVIPAGAVKKF